MFFDSLVNVRNVKNRLSLEKTVYTWPEEVWERLHIDLGYVKDKGNILVLVDMESVWIEGFPAGNRTSQTDPVLESNLC